MNLTEKAKSGLVWSGGLRALHVLVQFGLTLILARLLVPEEYGTYAVVAGLVGLLNALSFQSFIRYILQVRDDREVHYQDHFTAAVCLQGIIFLLANLVALGLRWIPSYAGIAPYIHVMTPVIFLSSFGGFRYVMLENELDWRRYRTLQAIGIVLSASVALSLALAGFGVYALLLAPLGKYIPPIFDLFLVRKWKPTWEFSWQNYRPAFKFGLNRMGSAGVGKGRAMLEANVLLFLVGLVALGYLNRAVGITQLVALQFAMVVGQAVYPVLTRVDPGTDRYRRASGLVFRSVAWVLIPVCVLLAILAEPAISTLLGAKWLPSAGLLPYALASGAVIGLGQIGYLLLLANCGQRHCLYYDIMRLGCLGAALALWPLYQNLFSYLLVVAGLDLLAIAILLRWLHSAKAIKIPDIVSALVPPAVASVVALAAVWAWGIERISDSLFAWGTIATGAVFGLSFALVIRFVFARQLAQILNFAPFGATLRRLLLLPGLAVAGDA